jgi:hypothetical protein
MLGVKLIATRFLPKVKIGDYEIEYTRRELKKDWLGRRVAVFHKEDKIKCKKTIEIAGSIDRKIKYIPQLIFQEINEEFENLEVDESSADFVSAFLECEDSRVILKRDVELYNEMFYKMLWSDYYYHGNDYFISDPSELDNEVMAFFKKYENVGVIGDLSAPGRIFCMCTNKLFDEIENEGRYAKLSQKLLQTLLIWVSEPRKNKLTLRTDENLRTIKMFEEIQPKISREIEEKYRDVINKLKQKLIY